MSPIIDLSEKGTIDNILWDLCTTFEKEEINLLKKYFIKQFLDDEHTYWINDYHMSVAISCLKDRLEKREEGK